MIAALALVPSRHTLHLLDALAVAWVVAFALLGAVAGVNLHALGQLSGGWADVADSLDQAARALAPAAEAPVVGDVAGPLAGSVAEAAGDIRTSATAVQDRATVLAWVIGAVIVLLPLPLVAGVYLPLRLARAHEVRHLRRLLAGPADPQLVEHLARGAVARIPYSRLQQISVRPWADVDTGRHRRLAAAELERLGVAVPSTWSDAG